MWSLRFLVLVVATVGPMVWPLASAQNKELKEEYEEYVEIRQQIKSFNLDTGNFYDAFRRAMPKIVRKGLDPNAATLPTILRFTTMLNLARFDAVSAYHPTWVGITTKVNKRPQSEWTKRNKNLAAIYACKYH